MTREGGHVLLLVGSPKGPEKAQSARLGRLVLDGLERRGWTSESLHLHEAVRSDDARRRLVAALDRASVVVFASPLYVDSLPAPAVRALEWIAAHRAPDGGTPRFVSIVNCGFLEPHQNDTCQRILQRFAERAGFEWACGVSIGAGGAITKRVRAALDLLVEAVDLELLVPDEVERLTRKPVMPRWMYILGGNVVWRRMARRHGAKGRLHDRPYERVGS